MNLNKNQKARAWDLMKGTLEMLHEQEQEYEKNEDSIFLLEMLKATEQEIVRQDDEED